MTSDLQKHIGLKVRQARKSSGLTQERLAERVKKYPETVSNIERGSVYVGLKLLEKLAAVLNVPMTYFFEGLEAGKGSGRAKLEGEEMLKRYASKLSPSQLTLAIALLDTLVSQGKSRK